METQSKILSNTRIARDVYKMILQSDIAPLAKPGQFVEIKIPGYFLRRPISISNTEGDQITIIYKIMGVGTEAMSTMEPGQSLNLVGPLGQGFPVANEPEVLILGGGVGVPPLLKTAKAYLEKGVKVNVVLGFNNSQDIFYIDAFEQIGITPYVATMDGSTGVKGTVLDAVREAGITTDFVLACGPLPMLRAIQQTYQRGYISLESRMGCGIGVCHGCVVRDNRGQWLRVCVNGPVFPIERVIV